MIFIYSFAEYAGPVFDFWKKLFQNLLPIKKDHAEPKSEKKFHAFVVVLLCINTLLFLLNQVFLQFKFGGAKSPCWPPNSSKIQIQNSKFTLSVSTDRGNLYEFYSIWNFLTTSGPDQVSSKELENATITSHFGFSVEENSGKEIIW